MSDLLVIYGAGGHGKVIAEILFASGRSVTGFLDDNPALLGSLVLDLPVFAATEWLQWNPRPYVALGIGNNAQREKAAQHVRKFAGTLVVAIHPAAAVARSSKIAEGVVIMPGAVLNPDCQVGEGTIINSGAIVEHDARIGRYSHLAPRCVTGGGASVGDFAQIGIGATVLPGKRVGGGAVIGAGAVVIDDIPENVTASGVPARIRSQNRQIRRRTSRLRK